MVSDEPFEGYHVLDELRDDMGVLLWQALRDVDLWASTVPEERSGLFTPGAQRIREERIAAEVPDGSPLRSVLETLSRVLGGAVRGRGAEVAGLCEEVSRWATRRGHGRTALAWAQRAAMAAPDEAAPAYLVGVVSRRAADYRRAETWFRRALALARRNRDWKWYGMAHLGIGKMYMQRGDAPRARARLLQALRAARRYGVWTVKPIALHDLFCIAANGGDLPEAEAYARAAYRCYGRRHPRLPVLAHDVAWFWMLQGQHERALPVFQAVVPHVRVPQELMVVWSNVARAAGGLGHHTTFERAWQQVWRLMEERRDGDRAAEALINLAHGAADLGDVARLELTASQALSHAIRRSEAQERIVAEELLGRARDLAARPREPEPLPVPCDPSPGRDRLREEIMQALGEVGMRS